MLIGLGGAAITRWLDGTRSSYQKHSGVSRPFSFFLFS
ncbi:hypothetical protein ATPR_0312 [Acetobacter tropicalis NBRC 101654]|uniref:Uncharacterized protein n=1 Tax=Acetobacter tropicalis NBRC 101654 TaxID=749388 RepID=F7VAB3_9PROT|nr:hypothetical protein ATPR_0312 [Acetobacter tropicalis NBRC 101654]